MADEKKSVPEFEVIYFNFTALAEPIRLILAFKDANWKDTRIDASNWPNMKLGYKWRQVPELLINGQELLSQSRAIGRYLAKKFDLLPKDDLESARCDEIVDALLDVNPNFKDYIHTKYYKLPGNLDEMKENIFKGNLPTFLKNFDDFIKSNHLNDTYEKGDFIFGKNITWADFFLAHYTFYWGQILNEPHFLKDYEALQKLQTAVFGLDRIKAYIASRPESLF